MSNKNKSGKSNPSKKNDAKLLEEIESLQNQLQEKDNVIEELESKYLRAVADYQNFQKRTEENEIRVIEFASENLIIKILEVMDDLDAFSIHYQDSGIDKIQKKLMDLLSDDGLEVIDNVGEEFDPSIHEAIENVNGKQGQIVTVHRKGYKYKSKTIRPAIVAVGNGQNKK